jgi:ectoine hydroxylase-related dioxygenase (phytanoyl-CoA dioxygenase family)
MSKAVELREKMVNDGYFIAENIVSEKKINAVLEAIFKIYCKYHSSTKLHELSEPWNNDRFHEEMIKFRQSDPRGFSVLYDSAQSSASIIQLVSDERIVHHVASLLGTETTELSITEGMVRMDTPGDRRNIAGWHQEISYVRNNGLVVWIPLSDITTDLGPLQICPKSHREGELKVLKVKNLSAGVSTVSVDEISSENIEKYPIKDVEVKKGDALFFDMKLFHRSGVNISNRIRFSCQTRYANISAKDFVPFRETKSYNKFVLEQIGRECIFPTH